MDERIPARGYRGQRLIAILLISLSLLSAIPWTRTKLFGGHTDSLSDGAISQNKRSKSPKATPYTDIDALVDDIPSNLTTPIDRRQTSGSGSDADYSCATNRPCSNGACCGSSGYCGYGPTYCGSGCSSNCNAKAECGQYASPAGKMCPLNVCCSQFGFCGTTSDFCDTGCQSNCGQPAGTGKGGGDVRQYIMGYWESWSASKPNSCGQMDPSQIPTQGLTNINYAFAYVAPTSYDIIPMPGTDINLFQKVAALKTTSPGKKVWVSIGGWSFNDNGTQTQPVFTTIAGSSTNRAVFAKKVVQFLTQYGFDGVDIDWEYPGAPDRGGNATDIQNFPLMLQAIKQQRLPNNQSPGLSITVPTSYWYLRWFDLPSISQYIDYFNLMSYDLHGIWDSTDPIGPHIYAHTNLTEIDLALQLFYRVKIPANIINLGLAFYGRSFKLSDPSCITPGCGFSGPGDAGPCTSTPGILSYYEIQNIIADYAYGKFSAIYDKTAGVKYLVYNKTSWISYDDKDTFQQKIQFANDRGLRGLFIWAVDQDDSGFTALKAVSGQEIDPRPGPSDTLGHFDPASCIITDCNKPCPANWKTITGLNIDRSGKGCSNSGKNSQQRSLCCPPWGAPDPATCTFRGSAPSCYGQCLSGEIQMATDNYGHSSHCNTGIKSYCCPATGNENAIAACKVLSGSSCPANLPQQLTTGIQHNLADETHLVYCCPAQPVWNNCGWHGSSFACSGNHCDINQVELLTAGQIGDSRFCIFGRQQSFCCDPAFNNTAILPTDLANLFPQTLPASAFPQYFEAFDHNLNQSPNPNLGGTDDPNRESFAWTIFVGAEADVQSLDRRDGTHLETFDCPNPDRSDYRSQKLKALCMAEGDDHNCEDILIGGAYGTIVKLPAHCGPDEYVRVVSFNRIDEYALPGHLAKRAPSQHKVYEMRYDYNFRNLRRDGGEIYIRLDASNHPGYWNAVVTSGKGFGPGIGTREEHMEYLRQEMEDAKLRKRGYSTNPSDWIKTFNNIVNSKGSGLKKQLPYGQVLYHAKKSCPPTATAEIEAIIMGEAQFTLDYGITLIGTLRNFDFVESYAYFSAYDMHISANFSILGNAGIAFQSQKISILEAYQPFGGLFNIKGLWSIGPYFDVQAQLLAQGTLSGSMTVYSTLNDLGGVTFYLPQNLGVVPGPNQYSLFSNTPYIKAGTSANISSNGSITITASPAFGFKIELDALGSQLAHTDIRFSFTNSLIARIGANTGGCNGGKYGVDYDFSANIDLSSPLPGWAGGGQHFVPFKNTRTLVPMECYPWSSSSKAKRELRLLDSPHGSAKDHNSSLLDPHTYLLKRQIALPPLIDSVPLFTDIYASALRCPNQQFTPTGNCNVSIVDSKYPNDPDAIGKRSIALIGAEESQEESLDLEYHQLEKRARKNIGFCAGSAVMNFISPFFPSSKDLIPDIPDTYGPLNPSNCDDYSFGRGLTPDKESSGLYATEHVLEFQLVPVFFDETEVTGGITRPKPSVPGRGYSQAVWDMCKYVNYFWNHYTTYQNVRDTALNILANQFPGRDNSYHQELILLEAETNNIKERLYGDGAIRQDSDMRDYVINNPNKAINVLRKTIMAIKYMQLNAVSTIYVNQATRIAQTMDQMEGAGGRLPSIQDPSYNSLNYVTMGMGTRWRSWIKARQTAAANKADTFITTYLTMLENSHVAPGDGDTVMGGTEEEGNSAIRNRITALRNAYNALPAWNNPFPAAW